MGKLSTHVLDTASGKPAQVVTIELFRIDNGTQRLIKTVKTNADGRTDDLLLGPDTLAVGQYALVFDVGSYFASTPANTSEPAFLDRVPVWFGIADSSQNYHVPLLISPWSYSTYRGS